MRAQNSIAAQMPIVASWPDPDMQGTAYAWHGSMQISGQQVMDCLLP